MSNGFEWTVELTFKIVEVIVLGMLLVSFVMLVSYSYSKKLDIKETEVSSIKQTIIYCLEKEEELKDCLKHNTYGIKIKVDEEETIVNKETYLTGVTLKKLHEDYVLFESKDGLKKANIGLVIL